MYVSAEKNTMHSEPEMFQVHELSDNWPYKPLLSKYLASLIIFKSTFIIYSVIYILQYFQLHAHGKQLEHLN